MKFRLLFITLFICAVAFSQSKASVSGMLTDKDLNNEALPFANVVIKGTTIATSTDETGKYTLNLAPGSYVIQFSFLGYETTEVSFSVKGDENLTINKALGSGGYQLTDVVVKSSAGREKETALLLE